MHLSLKHRLSYGSGGAVYAVKEAAYSMFVLFFYTQVLGLGGTATGFVLFLGLIWDAISDPLMGSWTDRFKSRWGRRHPFMVTSTVPLALGFIALFNPPQWALDNSTILAGWLLFCSIWIRTAVTVFALPHMALAAEMTRDYLERSRLLGMRVGFLFLTSTLLPALSMTLLFGEVDGEDGRFNAANYIDYGWWSAAVVVVGAIICVWGTRRFIPATRIAPQRMPTGSNPASLMRDFVLMFRNMNFRNLLFYDLAASASSGITLTLNTLLWTFYWELSADQIALVMGVPLLVGMPLALSALGPLGRRLSKDRILFYALLVMLLDLTWPYLLRWFELIPDNGNNTIVALLFVQNFIFLVAYTLRVVAGYSITADITDEHEAEHGTRQEGGLYSAVAFTTKLAAAAGPLYGGIALDTIGLTEGIMPGEASQGMLNGLMWAVAIGVIPLMLIACYFAARVSMTASHLQQIQQKIDARHAQAN
ncbi:MAG: sugar transporter [Halieaceae bacterium]|mgnify:CR=1 FL=1|nr:sugar transporter [Halieaceae bacterium]